MPGPSLLDRRLVIVTGKGGVGKSTVSAALALLAARDGKRVLVCEVNAQERVAPLLGAPPAGAAVREALPGISTVDVTPPEAMREYGLMVLRFKTIYDAVFENRLVRYFLRVVPSLAELVMLGKILNEVRSAEGGGGAGGWWWWTRRRRATRCSSCASLPPWWRRCPADRCATTRSGCTRSWWTPPSPPSPW